MPWRIHGHEQVGSKKKVMGEKRTAANEEMFSGERAAVRSDANRCMLRLLAYRET